MSTPFSEVLSYLERTNRNVFSRRLFSVLVPPDQIKANCIQSLTSSLACLNFGTIHLCLAIITDFIDIPSFSNMQVSPCLHSPLVVLESQNYQFSPAGLGGMKRRFGEDLNEEFERLPQFINSLFITS